MNRSAADILKFWHVVEYFSLQAVDKVCPWTDNPMHELANDGLVPWDSHHPLSRRKLHKNTTWQHTVYCHIYPYDRIIDALEDTCGHDETSFNQRNGGKSCAFVFSVTETGRVLFESFILSTSGWALTKLENEQCNDFSWLDKFDKEHELLKKSFATHCKLESDDKEGHELQKKGFHTGKKLSYEGLLDVVKHILTELEFKDIAEFPNIRIKSCRVGIKKTNIPRENDFLNSFYLNDLKKVRSEIKQQNYSAALCQYLLPDNKKTEVNRCDIRQDLDSVYNMLLPNRFPLGKWPTPSHYPLVLSQQFAINALFDHFDTHEKGIFSVNGPPGTGKTTLLRDLIADAYVRRAQYLAQHKSSSDVFCETITGWKNENYDRNISLLPKELSQHSIVIASNNNGAVENIALEIPGIDAIDPSWEDATDYFTAISDKLVERKSWALLTAKLGNKDNRSKFVSKFWYGTKNENDDYLALLTILKEEIQIPNAPNWQESVDKFNQAIEIESRLRKERISIPRLLARHEIYSRKMNQLNTKIHNLKKEQQDYKDHLDQVSETISSLEKKLKRLKKDYDDYLAFKPRPLETILTLGRAYMTWYNSRSTIGNDYLETKKIIREQEEILSTNLPKLKSVNNKLAKFNQRQTKLTTKLDKLDNLLNNYRQKFTIPDINEWKADEESKELSSPWVDDEWSQARACVFLEAINLHQAFILNNAKRFKMNLQAAMDILNGSVPEKTPRQAIISAWQTLFLVVPVISTTFASFDKLFKHLHTDDIGWLLIDEAGQATPQSAVGAIWRSQKVVIVGDPLQLEPIITLPKTAQQSLCKYYNVKEKWLPIGSSTQILADNTAYFGTYLTHNDKALWVSSPLRVHRRCSEPMFSIVNKIAYNNTMVNGLIAKRDCQLPPTAWLNVESQDADGHCIPDELKLNRELIQQLLNQGVNPADIFVISPFRQVAGELIKQKNNNIKLKKLNVGTIHTTQGKEAKVIILVLGGNPDRPRAKKWAYETPNMLNVAVSRAKSRLYVIGNRKSWEKFPYFRDLSELIDTPKTTAKDVRQLVEG